MQVRQVLERKLLNLNQSLITFFLKTIELETIIPRTSLDNGPLNLFNREVKELLLEFIQFLHKIKIYEKNAS